MEFHDDIAHTYIFTERSC